MDTPSRRKSLRGIPTKNYSESPIESPAASKSARKSAAIVVIDSDDEKVKPKSARKSTRKTLNRIESDEDEVIELKTPKRQKSTRKASEEPKEFSPKKLRANRTPSSKGLESLVQENSPSIEKLETPTSRRKSFRDKKDNQRYSDINIKINLKNKTVTPAKKSRSKHDQPDHDSSVEEISDEDIENVEIKQTEKPSTLFDEAEDVEGQRLYSLKTPKKKDSMAVLAQATPKTPSQQSHLERTPKTPKTPKNSRLADIQNTPTSRPSASKLGKTPRHIREATKKSKKICQTNSLAVSNNLTCFRAQEMSGIGV